MAATEQPAAAGRREPRWERHQADQRAAASPAPMVVSWILLGAGLALFAADLWAIAAGPTSADVALHTWFGEHRSAGVTALMVALSAMFGVVIESAMVGVVALAFWARGHPRSAALLIGAMAGSVLISTTLKVAVARPRPSLAEQAGPLETDYSFPSGHTISTAVFLAVAGYLWWRLAHTLVRLVAWVLVTCAVTALVACARIYLGVHYLSDTLASICLAAAILGLVMQCDRWTWRVHPLRAV